jgi:hypothetical protein
MRKLIGDAVEQAAVNIRDGQASGTLTIDKQPVGDYIITKVEVRAEDVLPIIRDNGTDASEMVEDMCLDEMYGEEDEEEPEPPCAMTLAKAKREEEEML